MPGDELDGVWKALSDSTRRSILDLLRQGPRTTTQIVEAFPHLSRFGVMKHMEVLREAGLIHTREERRQQDPPPSPPPPPLNSLNVVPIRQIYERWVVRFEELWASHLLRIKEDARGRRRRRRLRPGTSSKTEEAPEPGLNRTLRTNTWGEVCPYIACLREQTKGDNPMTMPMTMKTPAIVSPQEWEDARQQLLVKEKALTRARDALAAERRRMPWVTVEKKYEFEGASKEQGEPARPVRGPQAVNRLSRLLRTRRVRLARSCVPRMLPGRRSGGPPCASERSRHHSRLRLARAPGGHRAPESTDGLEDALVHHHRQLRRGLRRQ